MTVDRVHFLVEEASMEAVVRTIAPQLLEDIAFDVFEYGGKQRMLKELPARLKGYLTWMPSTWRLVVVVDRDQQNCRTLKRQLDQIAREAGLRVRSADGERWAVVNRIAIEELEAWFFGDWQAVRAAYPRVPATVPRQASYRDPDAIRGGTSEAFERVLQAAGYFPGGLRKIEAAEAIAMHIEPSRNRSGSFRKLRAVLEAIAAE